MEKSARIDGVRAFKKTDGTTRYEAKVKRASVEKSRTFSTKKEARAWRDKINGAVAGGMSLADAVKWEAGTLDVITPDVAFNVDTIVKAYLAYKADSVKPLASNKISEYRFLLDAWTGVDIRKVDYVLVSKYLATLAKTPIKRDAHKPDTEPRKLYAKASIRKFYFALKTSVEWHAKANRYVLNPHLFDVDWIPDAWDGQRNRRLRPGEEQRLYEAGSKRMTDFSPADWRALIGFALETAMRDQEIVAAAWADLIQPCDDQQWAKLHVWRDKAKTARDRIVLLSKAANDCLKAQRASCPQGEHRIFYQWGTPKLVSEAFARLTKRARIVDFHFHDLRHEAVSRLCEGGKLKQMEIMEMTDHTNMTTFKGYVHLLKSERSVTLL